MQEHESAYLNDLRAAWSRLSLADRAGVLADLSQQDAETLLYDWPLWARPNQIAPAGQWQVWLLLAGRGFGKTRTGAEWTRQEVHKVGRFALVAPTAADARDVMVEGESGILAISPPWDKPKYEPSKRRLTWPDGAMATLYSADEPERLRGPQHGGAWTDELCAWRYPEAWDMLMFGLRLGKNPQACGTTTPKPTKLLRELMRSPTTHVTRGSTYDNAANLARPFLDKIVAKYEGTRLGRQELNAEVLDDTPGALWKRDQIDGLRVTQAPPLVRVVVAIDPSTTNNADSDEAGIIVIGKGEDGHLYILDDLSLQETPLGWARQAITGYHKFKADRIIAESNNGGLMVEQTIKSVEQGIPVTLVWASRGKYTRAEPISALYEQGKAHHVGAFGALEDEMCTWTPGMPSPNRMDALVWGATELTQGGTASLDFVDW
jgi:phage terminase large subunit-like protein